jgi:hypothetical protein
MSGGGVVAVVAEDVVVDDDVGDDRRPLLVVVIARMDDNVDDITATRLTGAVALLALMPVANEVDAYYIFFFSAHIHNIAHKSLR